MSETLARQFNSTQIIQIQLAPGKVVSVQADAVYTDGARLILKKSGEVIGQYVKTLGWHSIGEPSDYGV